MKYNIKYDKMLPLEQVEALYHDVGWVLYTKDMTLLMKALSQSLDVISVWQDETLIGLIRTVGDGVSILYIQDILVLQSYQRQGIGKYLLKVVLEKYDSVRMKVLLTDQQERNKQFYESLGFKSADEQKTACFFRHDLSKL